MVVKESIVYLNLLLMLIMQILIYEITNYWPKGKLSSPEHKSIIIRIYKNINKRFLGNKLEKYNELIVCNMHIIIMLRTNDYKA